MGRAVAVEGREENFIIRSVFDSVLARVRFIRLDFLLVRFEFDLIVFLMN
jgi:hypothetical protein